MKIKFVFILLLIINFILFTDNFVDSSFAQFKIYYCLNNSIYKNDKEIFKSKEELCYNDKICISDENIFICKNNRDIVKVNNNVEYSMLDIAKNSPFSYMSDFYVYENKIACALYNENFNGEKTAGANSIYIYDIMEKTFNEIFHVEKNDKKSYLTNVMINDKFLVFTLKNESCKLYVYDLNNDSIKDFDINIDYIFGFANTDLIFSGYKIKKDEFIKNIHYDSSVFKMNLESNKMESVNLKFNRKIGRIFIVDNRFLFYPVEINKFKNRMKEFSSYLFFNTYKIQCALYGFDLITEKNIKTNIIYWKDEKKLLKIE